MPQKHPPAITAVCWPEADARGASTTGAGTAEPAPASALQANTTASITSRIKAERSDENVIFLSSNGVRIRGTGRLEPWKAKKFQLHFPLAFRLLFANNGGMAITKRQRQVYDFISRFVAEHGYSPSFEEIGKGMDLNSLATVHKHISNLEKKGLLTRDYNRSRSIDLLPPKGKLKQSMSVNTGIVLPLMGRIAAGQPIQAIENPETISLADFVRSKEV